MSILRMIVSFFRQRKTTNKTSFGQTSVESKLWFWQKALRFNRNFPWPIHFTSILSGCSNMEVGIDASFFFMPGCFLQTKSQITIVKYTQISENVGITKVDHNNL